MHQGTCKRCGGAFWESSKGARGEDLCDDCEGKPPQPLKRKVGTIDLTPTWPGILPLLLTGLRDGSPVAQAAAMSELRRMAQLAQMTTEFGKDGDVGKLAAAIANHEG